MVGFYMGTLICLAITLSLVLSITWSTLPLLPQFYLHLPIFNIGISLSLHIFLFSINYKVWAAYKVNYKFILNLNPVGRMHR